MKTMKEDPIAKAKAHIDEANGLLETVTGSVRIQRAKAKLGAAGQFLSEEQKSQSNAVANE